MAPARRGRAKGLLWASLPLYLLSKYIDGRFLLSHDVAFLSAMIKAAISGSIREKRGTLSPFYRLEAWATSPKAAQRDRIFLHNCADGRKWTYAEAYKLILQHGTWLKEHVGVKRGEIVALNCMNRPEFIWLWFGLWAIGAKAAFINYNLSGKPLVHCIKTSTANKLLVDDVVYQRLSAETDSRLQEIESDLGVRVIPFTAEQERVVSTWRSVREPDEVRAGEKIADMALLIYTSGTTGLPKPATVAWRKPGVSTDLVWKWMEMTENDVFYTSMPLYHASASILGLCLCVVGGATFALGEKFSTKTFWKDVRAADATIIQYVGETCRYLLAAPPSPLDKEHRVRVAFGNGMRPDVWDRFKERFGIDTIGEFYAATEGMSASFNLQKGELGKGAIGKNGALLKLLVGATQAVVQVDFETETPLRDPKTGFCIKVANGKEGELIYKLDPDNISEKFQGYFGNKEAGDKKMMRDVFKKGDLYFRTGDIVNWDGEMTYFSDRIGDTFRWKSENVSTAEVSEVIGRFPHIAEANVYGVQVPHHDGRAGMAAIEFLSDIAKPSKAMLDDLAKHVKLGLPRYAVPQFLRITRQMQRTGNNKQQKHVLRAEGVDPLKISKSGDDVILWLKEGKYEPFESQDWERMQNGQIKL